MTTTDKMHDLVDETSLWDALRALEQVCLDMAGPNKFSEPYEIAQQLSQLQHLASAYKLQARTR